MDEKKTNILLVEDNPDHAELALRMLEKNNQCCVQIYWVKDGEEALEFVWHRGRHSASEQAPRPDLILLDIKLPKVGGLEVLRQIKGDERLKAIPVVMLTTSAREDEVLESYRGGANSFITKPGKFAEYMRAIEAVKHYWTQVNRPPEE